MNTAAEYLQNGGTAAAHGSIDHIGPNPLVQGRLTNLRCGPAFLATRRCGARAPQNAKFRILKRGRAGLDSAEKWQAQWG